MTRISSQQTRRSVPAVAVVLALMAGACGQTSTIEAGGVGASAIDDNSAVTSTAVPSTEVTPTPVPTTDLPASDTDSDGAVTTLGKTEDGQSLDTDQAENQPEIIYPTGDVEWGDMAVARLLPTADELGPEWTLDGILARPAEPPSGAGLPECDVMNPGVPEGVEAGYSSESTAWLEFLLFESLNGEASAMVETFRQIADCDVEGMRLFEGYENPVEGADDSFVFAADIEGGVGVIVTAAFGDTFIGTVWQANDSGIDETELPVEELVRLIEASAQRL